MSESPYKCAVETKRVYLFEDTYLRHNKYLTKDRPMSQLRQIAQQIWKEEKIKRKMPEIVAGQGSFQNGRWLSFCEGDCSRIVLARNQRELSTLIHELVHALGPKYHNHSTTFVRKLFQLLAKYGRCDLDELRFAAKSYNIRC